MKTLQDQVLEDGLVIRKLRGQLKQCKVERDECIILLKEAMDKMTSFERYFFIKEHEEFFKGLEDETV